MEVEIKSYKIHPNYETYRGFRNDVCVLQLATDLTDECVNGKIKPIEMLDHSPTAGLNNYY